MVNDVVGLFYPRVCAGCDALLMKHEHNLCLECLFGLPKTYFWDYDVNPVEKLFWARLDVSAACSFLHFEKDNVVQHLLHRFKYQGKSSIGSELGRQFATILKEKNWFSEVDLITPIPLHISKEQRRGYNQSAHIANGFADVYEVPVRNRLLSRSFDSESQTNKSRYNRAANVDSVFSIQNPAIVKGKNVLLVDDVVTTGATVESAGTVLLNAGARRLYVATLAIA